MNGDVFNLERVIKGVINSEELLIFPRNDSPHAFPLKRHLFQYANKKNIFDLILICWIITF